MNRQIINTDQAPSAIGPYSQATRSENMIFTAGQIPIDPVPGKLVTGDIGEQTRQVLDNLRAVVEAGGGSLAGVMKTTVFLQDMEEFAEMNKVYGEYFPENPPARSTIEVAALPLGARVEIEAIALVIALSK